MKFLITFFIFSIIPFLRMNVTDYRVVSEKGVEAYTDTGYDQFKEINPVNEECLILHDMEEDFINSELKGLKKKFIGESEKIFNEYEDAKYVSQTIFSRSNQTRDAISFKYDTSTVTYDEVSVSVKGTLSAKYAYKGKKNEITVNGEIAVTGTETQSVKDTESNNFSVVIYPGKKVTLRVVGDCKVSNGVAKSYFFGIRTSQGAWEVIDITSTCCELLEEDA